MAQPVNDPPLPHLEAAHRAGCSGKRNVGLHQLLIAFQSPLGDSAARKPRGYARKRQRAAPGTMNDSSLAVATHEQHQMTTFRAAGSQAFCSRSRRPSDKARAESVIASANSAHESTHTGCGHCIQASAGFREPHADSAAPPPNREVAVLDHLVQVRIDSPHGRRGRP
jgi:hypothetical protein